MSTQMREYAQRRFFMGSWVSRIGFTSIEAACKKECSFLYFCAILAFDGAQKVIKGPQRFAILLSRKSQVCAVQNIGRYGHAVVCEQFIARMVASVYVTRVEHNEVARRNSHSLSIKVEGSFTLFDTTDNVVPMGVRGEGLRKSSIRTALTADLGNRRHCAGSVLGDMSLLVQQR